MTRYAVDVRNKKSGNSERTIFHSISVDEAYKVKKELDPYIHPMFFLDVIVVEDEEFVCV